MTAGKPLAPLMRNARDGAAEALYGLGGAGNRQGDELAALIYLRLALYLRPDHDLAAVTVANLFEDLKRSDEAIRAYDLVPASSPMRESAEIQTALELDSLGRTDEATTRMQRDRRRPSERPRRLERARQPAALGQKPSRTPPPPTTRRSSCSERPTAATGRCSISAASASSAPSNGRRRKPISRRRWSCSPTSRWCSIISAIRGSTRASISTKRSRCCAAPSICRPTDGYIVDSLGWANYKLGHYQEAADELEKAIDLKPADPVVNDHLGDAYWRVDRKIEAHFQWNHARDMGPEPEDLPKILQKIESGLPDAASAAAPAPAGARRRRRPDGGG